MTKRCPFCKKQLPVTAFHKDKRSVAGITSECKGCRNKRGKAWAENNKEYLLAREAKRRLERRGQCLISNARMRAKKRGLVFNLDAHCAEIQRRINGGHCEITGTPFDLSPGRKFNSPSIDRINPREGYVIGNVRVVCHAMNAAMGDWGEEPVWKMFQSWALLPRSRKRS